MDTSHNSQFEILDFQKFINIFLKYWWLIGSVLLIALISTYFINKYSVRIFEVGTSIIINDERNGAANASAQLMNDIGFLSINKNFANELLVIKSSPIIDKAIRDLDFRVSYYYHEDFATRELYKSSPFIVVLAQDHPQLVGCEFNIEIIDKDSYRITCEQERVEVYSFISEQTIQHVRQVKINSIVEFGKSVVSDNFKFKIIINSSFEPEPNSKDYYSFVINEQRSLVKYYQRRLEITPPDLESTVADISMRTSAPLKAMDFLNSLTKTYIENDLSRKKFISLKTIEYIDNQLNTVKDSLRMAEENLQRFRDKNEVIDISMQSGQIFEELNNLENQQAILSVNKKYYSYIEEYLNKNEEYSDLIAPSAMGINDAMLNNLIEELITLNSERTSLIENNQEKSPYLKKINIRIDNLRNLVSENISYYKQTNKIALDDINARIKQLNIEMRKLPRKQRDLLGFERKFNINDAIYTYLLEKKAEAEIAKASYQSDIEVIEAADILGRGPVSPSAKKNYLMAIIIGLFLPIGAIRFIYLLRTTFIDFDEVNKACSVPILGKVYHSNKKSENVVEEFSQSSMAESFRMIRFNLNYFMSSDSARVIVLNSSISGEGKSFVSFNLAQTIALSGSRTVLLGFDLRKPKDFKPLAINTNVGITSFLSGQATIYDIITKTRNENLDIVMAGQAPPNPAELISSQYTDELLNYLKEEYDYIIIDAPPVGIVSDGLLLMEKADLTIFLARIKHTPKKIFTQQLMEFKEKNFNTCIIVNDIPLSKKTKYGYGYYKPGSEKDS